MLGTYLGQFLPLSGGSNFPMTGPLYLDADGSFGSDGSGNGYFNGDTFQFVHAGTDANAIANNNNASFQIQTEWTLSGSNPSTDLIVNRVTISGSSTGTQLLADFQLNGFSEFHIDTSGNATSVGGGFVGKSFRSPTFSANTTIFVDPTNGSNISGNGSQTNPYSSISTAVSHATSGNLIFLAPGTYTASTQIVLPSGVSMKGSGIGVTILQPTSTWVGGLGTFVVLGNNSDVSDLTIDLTASPTTYRPHCIGCDDTAVGGSKQFGLNPSMHRVKCINTATGFYYISSSTAGISYLYLEDCIFISNSRCAQWYMTGTGGPDATFSADVYRCQFLFTYSSSVSNSGNGECVFAQAPATTRLFNCVLSMTDSTNTSWSSLGYQTIDADNPVELYGTHIITSFPNLPAPALTTVSGTNPGWWAFSNTAVTKIGAGCTVNPLIGDIGKSLYQTLPSPAPHSYALSIVPSSSTATPWSEAGNNLFEIATDAGTLTSNTLTIANVAAGPNNTGVSVALVDCQKMRLRIKNTNSGSTAMTLAFGTAYNTAAFTVSTIAAGKRAYLDFIYDADNSKWDLTGYVSGI